MEWHAFTATIMLWGVAVAIPGPDFLTTTHVAATRSRRHGLAVAVGVGTSTAFWAMAAILGLAALFAEAAWLYHVTQLAGATYLVILGLTMMMSGRRAGGPLRHRPVAAEGGLFSAYRRGVLTNLSNPKAAVFFTSLFTVGLPPHPGLTVSAMYVAAVVSVSLAWLIAAAVLLSMGRLAAGYRRCERRIEVAIGALLTGLGVRLAVFR